MTIVTPTPINKSIVFGYVFDGDVAVENAVVTFRAKIFLNFDNHTTIYERVLTNINGLFQAELPQTFERGEIVNVTISFDRSDGERVKKEYGIIVPATSPISLQDALAEDVGDAVISSGPQGPAGPQGPQGAQGLPGNAEPTYNVSATQDILTTGVYFVDTSGGDVVLSLPDPGTAVDGVYRFYKVTPDANKVTVDCKNGHNIGEVLFWEILTADSGISVIDQTTLYEIVQKSTPIIAADVKTLYESNANTNAFTDAEKTKLAGIETGATADQTGAEIKSLYEAEANTNAFTDAEKTKLAGIAAGAGVPTKEAFFDIGGNTNSDGNYAVKGIGATAMGYISFRVPHDFVSLVAIEVLVYFAGAIAAVDIDLNSSYGAVGELSTNHTESDTTSTYTANANTLYAMDVSTVFNSLSANDICGLNIDHNGIGTTGEYIGLRMRYN